MEKRTVIVTGGNSGLGYQCAKNIAMKDKDYTLVLACRNPEKAARAIQDMKAETGNENIHSVALDLASLESVRAFKELYKKENFPPLYSIVCNAGLNRTPLEYTKDGFEMTFGVCHLGHFLLAKLLKGAHRIQRRKVQCHGIDVFVSRFRFHILYRLSRFLRVPAGKHQRIILVLHCYIFCTLVTKS